MRVVNGGMGEVVGPVTDEDASTHLRVQFPGNKAPIGCPLTRLSRLTLLDYRGPVFFTGEDYTLPDGNRLVYGGKGEVVGPGTGETVSTHVAVQFSGNAPPPVECALTVLSRAAPPTKIPGGYKVGDEVFFTGSSHTFPSGNRSVYGGKGEVVGPATGKEVSTHVAVRFPGNPGAIGYPLTSLSRAAPPTTLPGGYRGGDEVFFTGAGKTFLSGNRVVHGAKGEVVGPGTGKNANTHLKVQFPGNETPIGCALTELSRAAP